MHKLLSSDTDNKFKGFRERVLKKILGEFGRLLPTRPPSAKRFGDKLLGGFSLAAHQEAGLRYGKSTLESIRV